jgi:hypothetical protein
LIEVSPAFKAKGIKEIEAIEWKGKPLDYGDKSTENFST